jgi:opacity protein-like surface antigen
MKNLVLAAVAAFALASPASAQDWAEQQNFLAQQQFNNQLLLQQQQQQMQDMQRQQWQQNWAMRCMSRNYQNCY